MVSEQFVQLATSSIYATGGQLYVETGGQVLADLAIGDCCGDPIEVESLHSAYCLAKPLLAMAVGHLFDLALVRADTQAREILPALTWIPPTVTVGDILAHNAGLAEPRAAVWRMTRPAARSDLLQAPTDARPSYSEVAGWYALAAIVEEVTGRSAEQFIEQTILDPLDLGRLVVVSADRCVAALREDRVAVPVAGLPHRKVPLLSEGLESQLRDTTAAFGGLVSASGLGRLFTELKECLNGTPSDALPSPTAIEQLLRCRRSRVFDPVLNRWCAFAGGFMVDLADHHVAPNLSCRAIGHAAGVVPSVVLCDPDLDLTIAFYLNGCTMSSEDLAFVRSHVISGIVRALSG